MELASIFASIIVFLMLQLTSESGDGTSFKVRRYVRGRVVHPDGTPAARERVFLVNNERSSMLSLAKARLLDEWQWVTDRNGIFVAELGLHRTKPGNAEKLPPGEGDFYFIVQPSKLHTGSVSRPIVNYAKMENDASYKNEWGHSLNLLTHPDEIVTLELKPSFTVEGCIIGLDHRPIEGLKVTLNHDLHPNTRTGYGGEIFKKTAYTGAGGEFLFQHVHPSLFYLNVEIDPKRVSLEFSDHEADPNMFFWLKTQLNIGGIWLDDRVDEFQHAKGQHSCFITIMGAVDKTFMFTGKIVDEENQPIPYADLTFGVSLRHEPKTFADFSLFETTQTDSRGNYKIKLPTPWARGIEVTKYGYQMVSVWDEGIFLPGDYVFKLKRLKPQHLLAYEKPLTGFKRI